MGREAKQRIEAKKATNITLARWAQENPKRFEKEWAKKVNSWLGEIWSSKIFLSSEEYRELVEKYPAEKETLKSLFRRHDKGVYMHLNTLHKRKNELGDVVIIEILSHTKGGKLGDKPLFSIVDRARKKLMAIGEKATALQLQETLRETTELLSNECCRALAPHIGHEIYSINKNRRPEKEDGKHGRRLKRPSSR